MNYLDKSQHCGYNSSMFLLIYSTGRNGDDHDTAVNDAATTSTTATDICVAETAVQQVIDDDDGGGGSGDSSSGRVDVNTAADGMLKIDDGMVEEDGERLSTGSLSSADGDSGGDDSDRSRHTVICAKATCDDDDDDYDGDSKDRLMAAKTRPAADATTSPPPDVIMHHNSVKRKGSKRSGRRRRSSAGITAAVPGTVAGDTAADGVQTATPACPARRCADPMAAATVDRTSGRDEDGDRSTIILRSQQVGRRFAIYAY